MVGELDFGRREIGAAFLASAALGLAAWVLSGPPASAQTAARAGGVTVEYRYADQPEVLYGPSGPVRASMTMASLGPTGPTRLESPAQARAFDPMAAARAAERAQGALRPASTPPTSTPPTSTPPTSNPARAGVKIGAPYQVNGVWYVPAHEPDYDEEVVASWYGGPFHGRLTANGEIYDQNAMTAAHPTLPMPSLIEVTNLENGRRQIVRLNDRGPFAPGRALDLSQAAAQALGMRDRGTARTRVRYIGPATTPQADAQLVADFTAKQNRAAPAIRTASLTPPPAAASGFFVQVGAFSAPANAERARAMAAAVGPVDVRPAVVNGATLYRVVIGPWASPVGAEAALTRLAAMGQNGARVVSLR